ncbi:MAG: GNAT family N-acetyltransferase [Anaerolineales bacterium]|nr:GNAT family N-acetyltransferase [Anaerolineales bacterium]
MIRNNFQANNEITRPAKPFDRTSINRLFRNSLHTHLHHSWRPAIDWIGQSPSFVAEDQYGLVGCLISSTENTFVSWLRAASVSEGRPAGRIMRQLFIACFQDLAKLSIASFCAMPVEPWFFPILQDTGFSIVEKVETWGKSGMAINKQGNQSIQIRPVRQQDIQILEAIEKSAHHPRWQYNDSSLILAMENSDSFTVALWEKKIVGFQISIIMGNRVHLARLTVLPDTQGQGIGTRLLADLINHYAGLGFSEISLNTQTDNIVSHRLYTSFGFQRISHPLSVWEYQIK